MAPGADHDPTGDTQADDKVARSNRRPKSRKNRALSRNKAKRRPSSSGKREAGITSEEGLRASTRLRSGSRGRSRLDQASRMRGSAAHESSTSSAPDLRTPVAESSGVTDDSRRRDTTIALGVRDHHVAAQHLAQERRESSTSSSLKHDPKDRRCVDDALKMKLAKMESRNKELASRCEHLEKRCGVLQAESAAKTTELTSYKAEVRAKSIAVGKAEIVLNEVCHTMSSRLGRAEGTRISTNRGRTLLEVHESPSEFAAQVKKNALLQLAKWETDRAALEALAERAGAEVEASAQTHAAASAELTARVEQLQEQMREMATFSERRIAAAEAIAEDSRRQFELTYSAKEELLKEREDLVRRNSDLSQELVGKEKEHQGQLDRFMQYPKAAEAMAEKLHKCQRTARREQNLVTLERKDFRRQLQVFQKWQTENVHLRERVKLQVAQNMTLRRQLAVAESGLAGSAATRKAVLGGTVDRLQRAEASAQHQANKYRELAGSRGVRLAQLETELASLKATVQRLRRAQEARPHDSYEMEIARLANTTPEVLEVQQRSGLSRDDMQSSMAQLKLLREKEHQKDALIALVRERDELELSVKELRARNAWLERKVLDAPQARRGDTDEVPAGAGGAAATVPRSGESLMRTAARLGGPAQDRHEAGDDVGGVTVSMLEKGLQRSDRAAEGLTGEPPDLHPEIRRKIAFLEQCDRSIEDERAQAAASIARRTCRTSMRGTGTAAVSSTRVRPRPSSAQGLRRPSSACAAGLLVGLFRGKHGVGARAGVSQDDSGVRARSRKY